MTVYVTKTLNNWTLPLYHTPCLFGLYYTMQRFIWGSTYPDNSVWLGHAVIVIFTFQSLSALDLWLYKSWDHSGHVLIQWETTLHCNVVSHWLNPYPKWLYKSTTINSPTFLYIIKVQITYFNLQALVLDICETESVPAEDLPANGARPSVGTSQATVLEIMFFKVSVHISPSSGAFNELSS